MTQFFFWICIALLTFIAWLWVATPLLVNFKQQKSLLVNFTLWLFPIVALGLYFWLGNWPVLEKRWQQQKLAKIVHSKMEAIKSPQQLADELKAHLQAKPQSAEGWYLLGKLYLSMTQYANALNSLQKAYQLEPNHAEYLLTLAEADLLNHQNHLSSSIETQLKKFLNLHPDSIAALNLLAINEYENHHYHQAVQYWQQALSQLPEGSPDSQNLLKMISMAQKKE